MRSQTGAFLLTVLATAVSAPNARAVAIPLMDPGFDLYIANTFTPVPDNRIIFENPSGSGSGPAEDVNVLDVNLFSPAPEGGGKGDVPAGWTATGQRAGNIHNTTRIRLDAGFDDPSGTTAALLSVEGNDTIPPKFSQTLAGVPVLPNSHYTATIQVSDIDIANRGPFMPPDDNVVLGKKEMIIFSLSASGVDLGGVLTWSDVTPGGAFNPNGTSISGGKSLLTLSVLTGESAPSGNLTIAITSNGESEPLHGFAPSAQTYVDNATLNVTPLAPVEDADFDGDNDVDGNDFLIWQMGLGLNGTTQPNGDADGNGTVNGLDLAIWKTEFATPQATAAATAIPEPAGVTLGVFALVSGLAGFGWTRSRSWTTGVADASGV